MPGEVAVTVPVYVTVWPTTAGFTDEPTVTAVSDWFIVSEIGAEVDVAKLTSPLKAAEIECGLAEVSAYVTWQVAVSGDVPVRG
jgi:hypothetical protein